MRFAICPATKGTVLPPQKYSDTEDSIEAASSDSKNKIDIFLEYSKHI